MAFPRRGRPAAPLGKAKTSSHDSPSTEYSHANVKLLIDECLHRRRLIVAQ